MNNNFINTKETINSFINDKYYTGAVIKITKNNKTIYKNAFGYNDLEKNVSMDSNLIFRIYSITKLLTTFAMMLLIDRKKANLHDDISIYLPNFKNKNITIWNLLTMTSGITYNGNKNNTQIEITKILNKLENENLTLDWLIDELSKIDLAFEPSTSWVYGLNLEIVSKIIEIITNMKFRDFVKSEILDKLDMNDTDFYLKDLKRMANIFKWKWNENGNSLELFNDFKFMYQRINKIPNCIMAGAGLFSTADDMSKFLNCLLYGKDKNNNSIISDELLSEIKKDQLSKLNLKDEFKWNLNNDYSYGLGGRVRISNKEYPITEINEYGWDGLLGSSCIVDTKNNITVTIMLSSFPGHNKMIETILFDSIYKDLKINNYI